MFFKSIKKIIGITIFVLFIPFVSMVQAEEVVASAEILGCTDKSITGKGMLVERESDEGIKQVDVALFIRGLKDGKHAVHVHETGMCTPCKAAKGHHDPGPNSNSKPDAPNFNHPFHMGDLVNIDVKGGIGFMQTTTNRFTLSDGRLSIFDKDGASFIIHSMEDKYCDHEDELKKGCAGGARDACGIIKRH